MPCRFPVQLNESELAAALAGLRLLQTTWNNEDALEPFYNLPPGLDDVVSSAGAVEPLTPDEIDSLCERINSGLAPVPLPEAVENIRSLLVQIVQYEAEQFDGPADIPLEVSGSDLVDWFTEIRKDAYEAVAKLDLALPVSVAYPPAPPLAALLQSEDAKAEPSPLIVTFKGGLTHPFQRWVYEPVNSGGVLIGDGPNGSKIYCDVAEIALAHFVDEIPAPMLQGAYGIFPEDETIKAPRTLDDV